MTYPFVQSATDLGVARGPRLAITWHMAEGGGTVSFLSKPNPNGVSVHFVVEYSGRIVQMLKLTHMQSSIRTSSIRTSNDPAYGSSPPVTYGRAAARSVMGTWADISHGTLGPNHASIGVEIEGFAAVGPNAAQIAAMVALQIDLAGQYHGIGNLAHRDFQDYKACPGKLIPWGRLGGHGILKLEDDPMAQLPITDKTPHIVDIAAPMTFYNLDGSVQSTGHGAVKNMYSPYIAKNGTSTFYAIYAGPPPWKLILTKPSAVRDVPPADCAAWESWYALAPKGG